MKHPIKRAVINDLGASDSMTQIKRLYVANGGTTLEPDLFALTHESYQLDDEETLTPPSISSGAVAAVVSSIVPVPERDDQLHDGFFSRSHSRAIAEVCEQFYFRRRGEHF